MRYLSVCSGIEAATSAWHPLGWEPFAFSEIEPFPSAVLAHHYPNVPNLGDMTKFKEWPDAAIDVLVGGTPCQSFSVAGLRKGLADPRGNLMLTYGAIAAKYRPTWLVWENVPGVLSSNGGRDFGTFLGMLGELGYGFAYRVLDAQYFGVAQRRRRVFVVGHLGDWRRAAAVLFERHSLQGHPAPRREAREVAAAGAGDRSAFGGGRTSGSVEVAACLVAKGHKCDFEVETFVAHSLRGEGSDASEDGTGRGTPLVPVTVGTMKACKDSGGWSNSADHAAAGYMVPVPIAFSCKDHGADCGEIYPTLRSMGHDCSHANAGGQVAVAFGTDLFNGEITGDVAATMGTRGSSQNSSGPSVMQSMQVRRLTPVECERLQGFPDNHTNVPYRGKPACDGPRYKALGNSMAVPVMAWIGSRIQMVEEVAKDQAAAAC